MSIRHGGIKSPDFFIGKNRCSVIIKQRIHGYLESMPKCWPMPKWMWCFLIVRMAVSPGKILMNCYSKSGTKPKKMVSKYRKSHLCYLLDRCPILWFLFGSYTGTFISRAGMKTFGSIGKESLVLWHIRITWKITRKIRKFRNFLRSDRVSPIMWMDLRERINGPGLKIIHNMAISLRTIIRMNKWQLESLKMQAPRQRGIAVLLICRARMVVAIATRKDLIRE